MITATITKWESHRDGKGRVSAIDRPLGRTFLINPNRIVDMLSDGTGSKFKFWDNHLDERENFSYVESSSSVAEITASHDDDPFSLFVTLPIFPKSDPARTPVDTTIPIEFIAYFDYNNADTSTSWIVYIKDGFRRVEALVDYSLVEIFNLIETGDIAGIVQYVEYEDGGDIYRKGVRNNKFVLDKALTALGFNGVENVDWENIKESE